ncbi:MAG TPA: hypothetical protein VGC34_04240 [Steroidobacteraceae bacterium]
MLRNLTPHPIALRPRPEGRYRVLRPDVQLPAVRIDIDIGEPQGNEAGVPIHGPVRVRRIENLPARVPGVTYVVSMLVAMTAAHFFPDRTDFVYPATSLGDGAEIHGRGRRVVARLARAIAV